MVSSNSTEKRLNQSKCSTLKSQLDINTKHASIQAEKNASSHLIAWVGRRAGIHPPPSFEKKLFPVYHWYVTNIRKYQRKGSRLCCTKNTMGQLRMLLVCETVYQIALACSCCRPASRPCGTSPSSACYLASGGTCPPGTTQLCGISPGAVAAILE